VSEELKPFAAKSGNNKQLQKWLSKHIIKYLNSSRRDCLCVKMPHESHDRMMEMCPVIAKWIGTLRIKNPEPIEVGFDPDLPGIQIRKAGNIQ
jgi:hypothetical protein